MPKPLSLDDDDDTPPATKRPAPAPPDGESDLPYLINEEDARPVRKQKPQQQSSKKGIWIGVSVVALVVALAAVAAILSKGGKPDEKAETPPESRKDKPIEVAPPPRPISEPPPKKVDTGAADRAAAEYTVSVGGRVNVTGRYEEIGRAVDLPKTPFTVTRALFDKSNTVTDAGLAWFKECRGLKYLSLTDTDITDVGLAHFKECKSLDWLYIAHTQATNAGVAIFKDHKSLTRIDLGHLQITDAALAHFGDYPRLEWVSIYATPVSDTGLAHLHNCKRLTSIDTRGSRVTAEGVAELRKTLPKCSILAD